MTRWDNVRVGLEKRLEVGDLIGEKEADSTVKIGS